MVDLLESDKLCPPLDLWVDARAVRDAVAASDICDPAGSSLKVHLISVRDRLVQGIIRRLYWLDTRDMVADGLTKGEVDIYIYIYIYYIYIYIILHSISNNCRFDVKREALTHSKSNS